MRNTVDILSIPVDNVTMDQAVEKVLSFFSEETTHTIYTPNAEIMMDAYHSPLLRKVLQGADLLIADGAGVVLASKILGKKLPEKVPGFDLAKRLLSISGEKKIKFFFFGSKPGVAETAARRAADIFPGVQIVGCRDGYFKAEDEIRILEQINSSGADVLLAALGAPKQELWIHAHKDQLKVKVCMGVGGTLDVLAGTAALAPEFFRRNGLEWLYRLYKEPWRYKRMLKLPKFVFLTLAVRLGLKKAEPQS